LRHGLIESTGSKLKLSGRKPLSATNGNAALYFIDRHRSGAIAAKPAFVEAGAGERIQANAF